MKLLKEKNITRANFISSVIIVVLISIALISTFAVFEYRKLSHELKRIEKDYTLLQKERIKAVVDRTVSRFRSRMLSAEKMVQTRLKDRVNEAHAVASNIYLVNKAQKSQKEIMASIIEALRPVRFNKNRGYFFIWDFDGMIKLNPIEKKNKGNHSLDVYGPKTGTILDTFKQIVVNKQEGFYKYKWYQPDKGNEKKYLKLSYVKRFLPFNWIIGAGEYIEEAENEIADTIIEILSFNQKKNKQAEYVFILKLHNINGGKEFGTMLLNPNLPTLVGKKIPDSYVGDRGKQFVKEMLPGLKANGEAFVQYWFKKPGSDISSPKLTYWKLFPEKDWIIGKGIYLDDLETILSQKKAATLLEIKNEFVLIVSLCLVFVTGAIVLAYLFSRAINTLFSDYKIKDSRQQKELLRFDLIINQAHDGIVMADSDGKVTYANRSWAKMHGYDPDRVIGQKLSIFHSPEQMSNEVIPCMEKVRQDGFHSCEIGHRHKDGSFFPTTMSVSTIANEKNELEGFLGIAIDISQIVKAKKKAEEANFAKSTFLANMSHEIRTPMNGIIGMTRLALDTSLSKEQRKFLNSVLVSANGLLGLLNDILDFSKIEAGQLMMENKAFSLLAMIDNIKSMMTFDAHKKGLSLHISDDLKEDSTFAKGDELRLRQILVNLISNSIKFTKKGSIAVTVSNAAVSNTQMELFFSVKDTGIGIPAAKQDTIFNSFSQADASTARQFGGTGLGLAITRQLVELMGGKISLESTKGQGACFSFNIVLERGKKEEIKLPLPILGGSLKGLDILLVEDNEINRNLAEAVLLNSGCRIIVAQDGLKALKILAREDVSLILMDIQMPVMDGFSAATIIRNIEKGKNENNDIPDELEKELSHRLAGGHLPIIALTANAMAGDKDKCIAMGMDAYLTKPFMPEDVFHVINRLDLQP